MVEPELRVGMERATIHPETEGFPLRGYTNPDGRLSEGIHDDLFVKSLCLSDGNTQIGIAVCDIISVDVSLTNNIRKRVANETDEYDEILIIATHTHSGPWIPIPAMDQLVGFSMNKQLREKVTCYLQVLERTVAETLIKANEELDRCQLSVGKAQNNHTIVNRRSEWPGEVRYPKGQIDPEMTVVLIQTVANDEIVLYNYPCHPVCATRHQHRISADWPGVVSDHIHSERPGTDILFLNGPAGNINPRNRYPEFRTNRTKHPWNDDDDAVYEYMEEVGAEIADSVGRAIANAEQSESRSQGYIDTHSIELQLPVKSADKPEQLRDWYDRESDSLDWILEREEHEIDINRLQVDRLLNMTEWDIASLPCPLSSIELGDVGLLTLPGEAFVEHGLRCKEQATVDNLLVTGLTNQNIGYIPTLDDLENGGYEVRACPLSPTGLYEFQDEITSLAKNGAISG